MENFDLAQPKEDNIMIMENSTEKKLNSSQIKIMDIDTFEDGVRKGLYSDSNGTAYLILNGILHNTYNVYIDSRRITKAGSVVSFESILKTYTKDQIAIRFEYKQRRGYNRRLLPL